MNLSQLECFVALTETTSFTEAAYKVGLTQSAVSHALSALESELGVTLIDRNRKGVIALTAAGQRIIVHARMLLTHAETIVQEAKSACGEVIGKIRLGGISAICPQLLAGALTYFQQQYPQIEVVLFEGTMIEVQEWIRNGIVDVGFVMHPANQVESNPIASDEIYVFVPEGHYFHRQGVATISELREERFITSRSGCEFMSLVGLTQGRTGPQIRYQASDGSTVLAMIREGLGVSILPRQMLPKKLEGVAVVPIAPRQTIDLGIAVHSKKTASPGALLFIQTALDWAKANFQPFATFS